MEPHQYLRLARRGWRILALGVVIGASLGWFTAPGADTEVATYYRGTHTLIPRTTGDLEEERAVTESLEQYSLLLSAPTVASGAADVAGGDPDDLADKVRADASPELGALYIGAFARDEQRAKELADAFAESLLAFLEFRSVQSQQDRLAALNERIEQIERQSNRLTADVAAGTAGNPTVAEAQLVALTNELTATFQQRELVANEQVDADLASLQPAETVSVSYTDFTSQTLLDEEGRLVGGTPPTGPFAPSAPARGILGGLTGLIIGAALVLVIDRFDPRLRLKSEVEEAFGLPVLAEVPPMTLAQRRRHTVVAHEEPGSKIADSYRHLRTSIEIVSSKSLPSPAIVGDAGPNANGHAAPKATVLLITSPGAAEGKTVTALNLAAVYVEAGQRVLLVGGDFRRPRLHDYLLDAGEGPEMGIRHLRRHRRVARRLEDWYEREVTEDEVSEDETEDAPSEAEAASAPTRLEEPEPAPDSILVSDRSLLELCRTGIPGLTLLQVATTDPDNPAAVMAALRRNIEWSRQDYDVVIVDTAPLLVTNDASELLSVADLVVLSAQYRTTSREAADRAGELLERLGAPAIGVVFVGTPDTLSPGYYYYAKDRRTRRDAATRDRVEDGFEDGAGDGDGTEPTPVGADPDTSAR